jgi:hypothetical protein
MTGPMTGPVDGAVDGALLSCYTSAFAEYLRQGGADWPAFLARDWVVAVRAEPDGTLAFVHHRVPLRRGRLALRRAGTDDPAVARRSIEREVARAGRAIVAGDVFHLPWSTGFRRRHAPHWYVVDATGAAGFRVSDPFVAVDAHGVQQPWTGWLAVDDDLPAARCAPVGSPEAVLRERYAFGARDPEPTGGYQWFEYRPGERDPGPLSEPGWHLDGNALRLIAARVRTAPGDPATYRMADDLWVAARHGLLYATWRRTAGLPAGGLAGEAAGRLWESLPMRLHYLTGSLRRGQQPRPAVLADPLEQLARLATGEGRTTP